MVVLLVSFFQAHTPGLIGRTRFGLPLASNVSKSGWFSCTRFLVSSVHGLGNPRLNSAYIWHGHFPSAVLAHEAQHRGRLWEKRDVQFTLHSSFRARGPLCQRNAHLPTTGMRNRRNGATRLEDFYTGFLVSFKNMLGIFRGWGYPSSIKFGVITLRNSRGNENLYGWRNEYAKPRGGRPFSQYYLA